jgi:hypothetical protein
LEATPNGLTVEGDSQCSYPLTVDGVPHPLATPIAVYESGVSEDLQVVGDGALALADWFDELANTDFPFGGGSQHGQESQADRITESVEADR